MHYYIPSVNSSVIKLFNTVKSKVIKRNKQVLLQMSAANFEMKKLPLISANATALLAKEN